MAGGKILSVRSWKMKKGMNDGRHREYVTARIKRTRGYEEREIQGRVMKRLLDSAPYQTRGKPGFIKQKNCD